MTWCGAGRQSAYPTVVKVSLQELRHYFRSVTPRGPVPGGARGLIDPESEVRLPDLAVP